MGSPEAPTDLDGFIALESSVWQALIDGDAQADSAALHDAFVGLYPTGYATKADHVGQLAAGPTVVSFALSDTRLLPVGEDAALLCYLATYRRVGDDVDEQMYVSSLWQRGEDGRWLNTFSQDTPATGEAVP